MNFKSGFIFINIKLLVTGLFRNLVSVNFYLQKKIKKIILINLKMRVQTLSVVQSNSNKNDVSLFVILTLNVSEVKRDLLDDFFLNIRFLL